MYCRKLLLEKGIGNEKKNRVFRAINGTNPDKIPRGDLSIEQGLLNDLLIHATGIKSEDLDSFKKESIVRNYLQMDLMMVHDYPVKIIDTYPDGSLLHRGWYGEEFLVKGSSTKLIKPAVEDLDPDLLCPEISADNLANNKIKWFEKNSDMFIFAHTMGPISGFQWLQGFESAMMDALLKTREVLGLTERMIELELTRTKAYLDLGADAVLIADDIGINTGLLYPPKILDLLAYPFYKTMVEKIKAYKNVPVFFHSDGNINEALESIISCGFDGIQSLQPSAGMDIVAISRKYPDICLMGNLDLNYLMPFGSPEEVRDEVQNLMNCLTDARFILSTCNTLTDSIPVENVLAMYLEKGEVSGI